MRDEHIKDMLDGAPLAALSEGELGRVRAHAARCGECARAFDAARLSAQLLAGQAAQAFEPSPFFQTRVMAALRERRAEEAVPAWRRLWRASGALVSSMAATVALLAGLTFLVPGPAGVVPQDEEVAAAPGAFSAEAALFAPDEEMDYEQVLTAVYASGEGDE